MTATHESPPSKAHHTNQAAAPRNAEQVRRHLVAQITSGRLPVGAKVGSERQLANTLGVSRAVVRHVLAGLASAGLVRRVAGRAGGTFVSRRLLTRDPTQLTSLVRAGEAQGIAITSKVTHVHVRGPHDTERDALDLAPGDTVVALTRMRMADGIPFCLEHTALSARLIPGIEHLALDGSLYELLHDRYGIVPASKQEEIAAAQATPEEAADLDVPVGSPLLSVRTVTRAGDGTAFEVSCDVYRADRMRIVVSGRL